MNRYKGLFSLILVTALLWNIFHVAITYGYYYIDQSGFIEQFCVNIEKPELKCDGKCHLKEITEKDATNNEAPLKMMAAKDITLFVQDGENIDFGFILYSERHVKKYNNLYSYLSEFNLYQPPQTPLT